MAIINNTHRFIFIHIPKAAGTSLSQYYCQQCSTIADVEIGGSAMGEAIQAFYLKRFKITKHATALEIRTALGMSVFNQYFRFSFVRNPFDRTISTFKFLKKWLPGSELVEHANVFGQFDNVNDMINSAYWETPGIDKIFQPQWRWLYDDSGMHLANYIGKVEAISDDVKKLNCRLGLNLAPLSIHNNKTSEDAVHLSASSMEKISNRYCKDFEIFGYGRSEGEKAA